MTTATASRVTRIEIRQTEAAGDPTAQRVLREAGAIGLTPTAARTAKVYLLESGSPLDPAQVDTITARLLADAVKETAHAGAAETLPGWATVEVHPLPGVMDPAAASVADALRDLLAIDAQVSTGTRYDLEGVSPAEAKTLADRLLANPVVSKVHTEPFHPESLPKGSPAEFNLTHIPIRDLTDAELERLSREAHLFLSLEEMQAIRTEYQTLGREPTDIELETLAQTWSEHCVHKTLKSTIRYTGPSGDFEDPIDWTNRPDHEINADGSITINNLLKSTVAAATFELIDEGLDWCLSVFVDNAGIIRFDDDTAVCVKVETHNHPSALEPYGGAATGIGGCIRDIIGTGLAAKPIASTDVFCVGTPDIAEVPAGCIHPTRILSEIVAGVRDYGNRMGIPTLNGAVWFDDRYVGNPLVYCGCIGVMPADKIDGHAQHGDLIVALGGRTGRDGIHGATFSSAELTDTHADEFAHAVQIGNAIEEKRVLDAILRARDAEQGTLFTAITDCGAGGFSSAIGEMGEKIGAEVHLENAPLKYAGLTYTEIWISEAQERMVLAVPKDNLAALQAICDEEHVELAVLGTFGTDHAELILNYNSNEVGRLPMAFLHDGIPTPTREAEWKPAQTKVTAATTRPAIKEALLKLLAHPNIASKHAIIRQYDHEVQGNTLIRPLGGPLQRGPMDAAVVQPVPGSNKALAIACGLATGLEDDPYLMTLAAVDECVRNLVCVGANPDRIAILDNFCWPSCRKPENLASLVRAAEGCYDAAKAYKTPFISGKDSLNNQFTTEDGRTIEIPPTLLISGVGIIEDIDSIVTMDAKRVGHKLVHIAAGDPTLRGSHYERLFGSDAAPPPTIDPNRGAHTAAAIHQLIKSGKVLAAHDVSDGGALTAIAEMLIAGSHSDHPIGLDATPFLSAMTIAQLFGEPTASYIVEIDTDTTAENIAAIMGPQVRCTPIGTLDETSDLRLTNETVAISTLSEAWINGLTL